MTQAGGAPEPDASVGLGHYPRLLKRRLWVVILGALLGLGVAVAYLVVNDRTVTATNSININVITSEPFTTTRAPAELIDAETEIQTVTSSAVLNQAAAELGDASPSEVRADTEAKLLPDATIMRISYSADSTEEAEAGADAVAEAYLDFRGQEATDRVDAIVDRLQERRDDLRQDLVRINAIISATGPNSRRALQAESDRQLINIELDTLSTEISGFLGLDTTGGRVLTTAEENPTTVAPSRALVLAVGLLTGTLLGVALAFLLAALDRRVRDEHDVRRFGGGEVVGRLTGATTAVPMDGTDMDELRAVRERLLATMGDGPSAVVVADESTAKGRVPDVAANLAVAFAETGQPVELVLADADEETRDVVTEALGLAPVAGGTDGKPRLAQQSGQITVTLPPRGIAAPSAPRTNGAAGRPHMSVIAIPRGASDADLLSAARSCPRVLLVVSRSGTQRAAVSHASRVLAVVGAVIHGTILVPRRRRIRRRKKA